MYKPPVKTLIMTEVNKKKETEDESQDKYYSLEDCAKKYDGLFDTFGKAWRHCAKKKAWETTEVVRHGANPNLKPGHTFDKHEFMENTSLNEDQHYVSPLRTHLDINSPKGPLRLKRGLEISDNNPKKQELRSKIAKKLKDTYTQNRLDGIPHKISKIKSIQAVGGIAPRKHLFQMQENTWLLEGKALEKVERVAGEAANAVVDVAEAPIRSTDFGEYIRSRLYKDPSKQSRELNAKEWAGLMGAGTIGTQLPHLITGDVTAPVVGALAAGNAAKGAIIGPMFTGGKDTLLKSTMIPAGVVAVTTPLINDLGNYMDLGHQIDLMPEARVGLAGTAGAGMWALRNRKKKIKNYY